MNVFIQQSSDVGSLLDNTNDSAGRGLRRGLGVLEAAVQSGRSGIRVIDLCRQCGLERATVYRLLDTLIDTGYVAKEGRFRYVAGPRATALTTTPGPAEFARRLQPLLAKISSSCGDAAFAVVRESLQSHCIAREVGTHPVQVLAVQVGHRQPLGVGAAGLALLAALNEEETSSVIEQNASSLNHYGSMTPERLQLLVCATRERGWSVVGNHVMSGVLAVGMAVFTDDQSPLAAISVASTVERMPRQRQQLIARLIRNAIASNAHSGKHCK